MTTEPIKPRIAVIDDEPGVGELITRVLKKKYRVRVFNEMDAILESLQEGERYEAIICDLIMPGVSGRQIYDEIADRWPEEAERVIFISGVTANEARADILKGISNPLVGKPFELSDLREAVGDMVAR